MESISILLLGDAEAGKSTFLARLANRPLRDEDQPFPFDIRLPKYGSFRLEFSDTSSPTNYTLLKPACIVLCYDISVPSTLTSLSSKWKYIVETHFNYNELLPVLVLGLKRDVRNRGTAFVLPQEGLRVAQEMRCDRYLECSALTGELCREVIEDITNTAVMTTTAKGGRSEGATCNIM
ncbi:P-loop containing nucleoside triphosphate hydrolase protein [Piedraia hortae CBS 480.64]|uniref:P-loop containing nucleoside triphosphate hydrolase protein n=1 Tax=Piedraia hortae CBS 480.64 TaxID=1314780 RepID=A0A6A7C258_9PEZI|nr:P-loop containing nucleoside triphosphate hydrolase protein [Piedraia hortae CBS 480.64]